MFNLIMENKGFTDNQANIETPSDVGITEKPLKTHLKAPNRVDINVLKSKLQETESKNTKRNIFIFTTLILALGFMGIYFSM